MSGAKYAPRFPIAFTKPMTEPTILGDKVSVGMAQNAPIGTDATEGDEGKCEREGMWNQNHGDQDAGTAKKHRACGVKTALAYLVRVTGDEQHRHRPDDKRKGVEKPGRKTAQLPKLAHGARQPKQKPHLSAYKAKVDRREKKYLGPK